MRGQIIHFGDFRRFNPPPNGLSQDREDGALQPSTRALASGLSKKQILRVQVTRIGQLLDELEALAATRDCDELPVVGQLRAVVEKARVRLAPERSSQATSGSHDPQPDVDRDMLERMYQTLNSDA